MSKAPCPCGLTQEKLDAHADFLNGQICKAEYTTADGNIDVCGRRYADHPSAPPPAVQGKQP